MRALTPFAVLALLLAAPLSTPTTPNSTPPTSHVAHHTKGYGLGVLAAGAPAHEAPGAREFTSNTAGVIFYSTNAKLTIDTTTCELPASTIERVAGPAQGRMTDTGSGELDPASPPVARGGRSFEERSSVVLDLDPESGEFVVERRSIIPVGK